jgi:hypothetical protein
MKVPLGWSAQMLMNAKPLFGLVVRTVGLIVVVASAGLLIATSATRGRDPAWSGTHYSGHH